MQDGQCVSCMAADVPPQKMQMVTNMIWNILYEAGAIGLNNGHFPTQAREPPVGEGFGSQSEQAPEGGNDSRLVKGE